MAKRESIVPGLGKQQAKVLNNEAGRRAEHKRHLEELGFPKEVDPAFMRYAPVSYDDETPYPSKVVNQAGEDLGFTPKDSLMKQVDVQSIVKEAAQEIFVQKDWLDDYYKRAAAPQGAAAKKSGGKLLGKLTAGFVPFLSRVSGPGTIGYYSSPKGKKELAGFAEGAIDFFAGLFDPNYNKPLTEKVINDRMETVAIQAAIKQAGSSWKTMSQAQQNEAIESVKNSDSYKNAYKELTKDLDATSGVLNQSPMNLDKKTIQQDINEQLTVDPKATDPAGVPLEFQPGGRPDTGKTYEAGKGQTKDQSMEPIDYDPKRETDAIGMPRRFEPGASGPTRRGEVQQFVPGPGQTKTPPAPKPKSLFGQLGPRKIDNIQERDGKLFGTVSGSGTSPYQIQVDPKQYGGVKAGDTINYNPAQDPKAFTITSGGTTTAGKKSGPTLAEAQAKIRADYKGPPVKNVGGTYYEASMQKQDGFDYGGFAPGFSRRPSGRRPSLGERPTLSPEEISDLAQQTQPKIKDTAPQRGSGSLGRRQSSPPPDPAVPRDQQQDDPKGRYDSVKQRDLQRTPAPPTLKNMQKYQAWLQKAEDEGAMAKVQLDRVSDLASMMHDILEDEDQLPGWIQNKISDSLHNLEASITHVMYDEKEDRDLVKSKEIFQDFLVRAPQGGGEHLEKVAPIVPAVAAVAGSTAVRTAAPFAFLKIAPKLAKFVGKLFGKKNAKDVTKETLENTAKKGFTKKQAALLAAPLGGAYLLSQGTDDPDEKAAMDEMQKFGQDLQNSINDQMAQIGQGIQDKYGSLSTEIADFQAKVQQQGQQPSPSNQQIGQGMTDAELGRRGATVAKPSYTQPIYDTSPEAEARVRAGGSESIIGAEVDGQKYQFKQPVSNMGQINQALQRATPVREIVKEAVFELSKAKKKGGRKKDPRLARAGVEGFNKPKRTPKHPTKSHIVVAKEGNKIKTIRYGQQGAKTAGDPKKGESEKMKKKRKSFKARHRKNIKRGKMSAAYWADRSKW